MDNLIDQSTTDFDLYLEVPGSAEAFTLYARGSYKWTRDELTRLLAAGHASLYYSTADRARVEAYRAVHQRVLLPVGASPSQRVISLTDTAAELTRILYQHPLSPMTLGKVEDIASAMVDCIQEDPACVTALGKLARHDDYTYYHSARVCAYAIAIAVQMSLRDPARLRELATGSLLHDVGKSRINLEVLNKPGALTPEEWVLLRQHPVFGGDIVGPSALGVTPRSIIMHHHERLDGTGYPHQLAGRELLEEVKIAAVADVFDALTTNRPYHVSRTHFEALTFMKDKLMKNLHHDAYEALVAVLGAAAQSPSKKGA